MSGAVERGHDFLFVLYDNEGYMNTGIQRSGGTPKGAATTTTPAGSVIPGKLEHKKPITDIMVAHDMAYVATASPYYWRDMLTKVRKGLEVEGPAFLHVFAPCPRGWRSDPAKSIEYSKLAVESCVFPVWEAVNGQYQLSVPSKLIALAPQKKKPVTDYLQGQGRLQALVHAAGQETAGRDSALDRRTMATTTQKMPISLRTGARNNLYPLYL